MATAMQSFNSSKLGAFTRTSHDARNAPAGGYIIMYYQAEKTFGDFRPTAIPNDDRPNQRGVYGPRDPDDAFWLEDVAEFQKVVEDGRTASTPWQPKCSWAPYTWNDHLPTKIGTDGRVIAISDSEYVWYPQGLPEFWKATTAYNGLEMWNTYWLRRIGFPIGLDNGVGHRRIERWEEPAFRASITNDQTTFYDNLWANSDWAGTIMRPEDWEPKKVTLILNGPAFVADRAGFGGLATAYQNIIDMWNSTTIPHFGLEEVEVIFTDTERWLPEITANIKAAA